MAKKPKTETVIANFKGKTSDIGDFEKDQELDLPPKLAEAAVENDIARWPDGKAPAKTAKKTKEVTDDAGDK